MTTSGAYRPTAQILHWITALLVLATVPAGLVMIQEDLPRKLGDTLFIFHKNTGIVILLLVACRLVFRAFNPAPPLPTSIPRWQRRVATASHWLLYLLLIGMAVSGYIRVTAGDFPLEGLDALGVPRPVPVSESLADTASRVHSVLRYPLVALVILHIGAALHHALVRRDGVFGRMLPGHR